MSNSRQISSGARRRVLKKLAVAGGGVAVAAATPRSWKRPIVDAVMLPAHAATSGPLALTYEAAIIAAASEFRLPSGGAAAVESLSEVGLQGCASIPDQTVTATAIANMTPTGTVVLGSGMATGTATGSFLVSVSVPGTVAAELSEIVSVSIELNINGVIETVLVPQAALIDAINGNAPAFTCSV